MSASDEAKIRSREKVVSLAWEVYSEAITLAWEIRSEAIDQIQKTYTESVFQAREARKSAIAAGAGADLPAPAREEE